ncbi:phage terminase small subunit P27 family [Ruminiclostridium cellobioparum]|uniref:Phage terminase, small subunit, putative, P27 family n=1 Tax=Ruminiclostridium cellobioparum subsp. termitidis CT1112 TaxID=1195236 RepID=S0FUN8_RUMCE|nr:phage terminase small subunit P27 family [Ruminiclostridium cellobioparum]EMS74031.1 phage terminase, small subunit, putative, P27 family [Ruminiclostridium cellobioparum subsp. termitidis CT1112]
MEFLDIKVPSWLGPKGKEEYKRIAELLLKEGKEFTEKDYKTLELYADSYDKWLRCEKFLKKNGYSYICKSGYPSQYPEVTISSNAQKTMLTCARELGLTPAARSRMNKNSPANDDDSNKTQDEKDMDELMS